MILTDSLAQYTRFSAEFWRDLPPGTLVHRDDEASPDAPVPDETLLLKKGCASDFDLSFLNVEASLMPERAEVHYAHDPARSPVFPDSYYEARLFLPLLRMLRGGIALHASAVSLNQKATLFLAPSGVGKSTCAAALIAFIQNTRMLSDDTVVLAAQNDTFFVLPASRSFAMRHDPLSLYYDAFEKTDSHSAIKSFLTVKSHRIETQAVPADRLVFLQNAPSGALTPVTASQMMSRFFAQQFTLTHAPDSFRRAQFAAATALLNAVPCFTLDIDFSSIDGIMRAVHALV